MADTVPPRPRGGHDRAHHRHCGHASLPPDDRLGGGPPAPGYAPGAPGDAHSAPGDAHSAHMGHMHFHDPGCGHDVVVHDDHVDFVHGGHRHAAHGVHYDEH